MRALVVAAVALMTCTGAAASSGSQNDWCDDGSVLSSMSAMGLPEVARGEGDFPREPDLNMTYEELPASAVGKGKKLDNVIVCPSGSMLCTTTASATCPTRTLTGRSGS